MSNRFLTVYTAIAFGGGPIKLANLKETGLNVFDISEVRANTVKVTDGTDVTERQVAQILVHGDGTHWQYAVFDKDVSELLADIERRIHCEMDYARTGATVLGPPGPVRLGSGGSENNQAVAKIVVADIDLYPVLRFSGRSGATAAKALVAAPFTVDVPVSSIGVATTPLPSKSAHLVGQSGTVYVSRADDGTSLYLLGEDSAAAFGVTVEGIPQ